MYNFIEYSMIYQQFKEITKIIRSAMEVEERRPVGRQKKTWSKVVKEDMKKLNITVLRYGRG